MRAEAPWKTQPDHLHGQPVTILFSEIPQPVAMDLVGQPLWIPWPIQHHLQKYMDCVQLALGIIQVFIKSININRMFFFYKVFNSIYQVLTTLTGCSFLVGSVWQDFILRKHLTCFGIFASLFGLSLGKQRSIDGQLMAQASPRKCYSNEKIVV